MASSIALHLCCLYCNAPFHWLHTACSFLPSSSVQASLLPHCAALLSCTRIAFLLPVRRSTLLHFTDAPADVRALRYLQRCMTTTPPHLIFLCLVATVSHLLRVVRFLFISWLACRVSLSSFPFCLWCVCVSALSHSEQPPAPALMFLHHSNQPSSSPLSRLLSLSQKPMS